MRITFRTLTLLILVFAIPGCATLKPHPKPWSKTDKLLAAYFIAGHTFDAYTTERLQDHPERFYETNPFLGRHPKDHEIVAYFSITGAAALLLAHLYPELRPGLLIFYGSVGMYYGFHNYDLLQDR